MRLPSFKSPAFGYCLIIKITYMQLSSGLTKLSKYLSKREKLDLYLLLLKGANRSADKAIQGHIVEASKKSINN